MVKVKSIELRADKNNNPLKYTTFEDGQVVYVNSKYDAPIYESVVDGAEFELVKDGNFNKIKYDKPQSTGGSGIKQAMAQKQENIGKSMDRKENSITLAGTARDATLITVAQFVGRTFETGEFQTQWQYWRTWLIDQAGDPKDITETKQPF